GKRSRPCTLRASKPARERAHCIQRKFQRVGGGAMTGRYAEIYARSLRDPEGFWGELAQNITWTRKWDRVLDDSRPPFYRWFPGGELNTCFNTLDRHLDSRGDQAALIYDSAVTGTVTSLTYRELRDQVARFAGALAGLG